MKLIVGLGNPGMRYAQTRHNVGFWVIDQLSERWGLPLQKEKAAAQWGEGHYQGEKVILLKPLTYMNRSGEAVQPLLNYFGLSPADLLVIYDDLDLPLGHLRLRMKGSSGGHNGLKSIIAHLNTEQWQRIKIGIGRPTTGQSISDYVLSPFSRDELPLAQEASEQAAAAVECTLESSFTIAMNRFNTRRE
jgi:PTH1 family peptidyl-tRNA hydrolase